MQFGKIYDMKQVDDELCCLVEIADIEQAEQLSRVWNRYHFQKDKILKVNIHPSSNMAFRDYANSHHLIFKD